jgi:peptidoglycan hydrolase CwlO-like protein
MTDAPATKKVIEQLRKDLGSVQKQVDELRKQADSSKGELNRPRDH